MRCLRSANCCRGLRRYSSDDVLYPDLVRYLKISFAPENVNEVGFFTWFLTKSSTAACIRTTIARNKSALMPSYFQNPTALNCPSLDIAREVRSLTLRIFALNRLWASRVFSYICH